MTGALLSQARLDNRNIISADGFNTDITFTSRDDSKTSVIQGTATLHNTGVDTETGIFANIRSGAILVSIADLVDDGFPVFTGKVTTEPDLKGVKISFVDANGKTQNFKADDVRPSDTFGCVTIILGVVK